MGVSPVAELASDAMRESFQPCTASQVIPRGSVPHRLIVPRRSGGVKKIMLHMQ